MMFNTSGLPSQAKASERKPRFDDFAENTSPSGSTVREPVKIPKPITEASSEQLQGFILDALAFKSMTERQEEVAEAHKKTFGWIFKNNVSREDGPRHSFLDWLRGGNNEQSSIYWISGKAGSGKSTLLRFIYDHEMTTNELGHWAGSKPFTKAGFFFWTSGSLEQRSQAGLLRSLLYQLLDQHQEFISVAFPSIWGCYKKMTTKERVNAPIVWTLPELMTGLKLFLQNVVEKSKICLFVDGLDEFEGDHTEIISLFTTLVKSGNGNVKACLSSRPWSVFLQAFELLPHLTLHSLTVNDRRRYVVDKFKQNPAMGELVKHNLGEGSALVEEVVQRADGVFLWVILVVKCLLEDLKSGDQLYNVKDRLKMLPTDLEEFFKYKLFDSQNKETAMVASQTFQMIRSREIISEFTGDYEFASLSVWELALACNNDNELVLRGPIEQPSSKEIINLCGETIRQIDNSCVGLLEIHSRDMNDGLDAMTQSKITYLHRTVRDWLVYSPKMWDNVLQYTASTEFDPNINHLKSYILQLKLPLQKPRQHRRYLERWDKIVLSLTHARYTSSQQETMASALIDELNETLCFYWLEKPTQIDDHWARSTFGSYEEREKHSAVISHPFLSLAAKFGLEKYILIKISSTMDNESDNNYHGGKPILGYALDFLISRRQTVYPLSSPSFVKMLLECKQDPNLVYSNFQGKKETPWLCCLRLVREALRRDWIDVLDKKELQRWTEILCLLVHSGADINLVILADAFDPEIRALAVIEAVLEKFDALEIRQVRDLMVEKGAN